MNEPVSRPSFPVWPVVVAWLLHVLLAGVALACLVIDGPRFAKIFADFNLKLPLLSEAVFTLSRWLVQWLYVVALFVPLLALADALVLVVLFLPGRRVRWLGHLWAWGVVLALLAGCVLIELAYRIPMTRLLEGLSR